MRRLASALLLLVGCYTAPDRDSETVGDATTLPATTGAASSSDATGEDVTGASAVTTDATGTGPGSTTAPPATGSSGEPGSSSSATTDPGSTGPGDTTGPPEPAFELLLDLPGPAFTPDEGTPYVFHKMLGTPGVHYARVEVELDVAIGEFRTDIPPNNEERWDHILFGLYRDNQPQHYMRYLLGASARIETNAADRAFHYGRVEIAEGPPSYTAWKKNLPWQEFTDYHLFLWIDAGLGEQTLEVRRDGQLEHTTTGPVPYFTADLTADQLYLELGTEDADWGLHVSPHGWVFSDVQVRGWPE